MTTYTRLTSPGRVSTCVVSSFGARLIEWRYRDSPLIFRPASASPDDTRSPHGGVPVLFPQFGNFGPGEKHGIVRSQEWELVEDSQSTCLFKLRAAIRGQALEVYLRIDLNDEGPEIYFSAVNASSIPLSFTCGLHTYVRVADIQGVVLHGLENTAYQDALRDLANTDPSGSALASPASVDRVYAQAPDTLIVDTGTHRIEVAQSGFNDVVVWNPGEQTAKSFVDLAEGEWQQFLCVEAAQIRPPVQLGAWDTWYGSQSLRVIE